MIVFKNSGVLAAKKIINARPTKPVVSTMGPSWDALVVNTGKPGGLTYRALWAGKIMSLPKGLNFMEPYEYEEDRPLSEALSVWTGPYGAIYFATRDLGGLANAGFHRTDITQSLEAEARNPSEGVLRVIAEKLNFDGSCRHGNPSALCGFGA